MFFAFAFIADRAPGGDDRIGVPVDAREDGRKRRFDRVSEHVRAAHHRHTEHDRNRCERRSQLASEQALERDPDQ